MRAALLIFLLACTALAQTRPLIMRHADSLSVARKSGFVLLKGNVKFTHDSATFTTAKATWNRHSDVVQCEGYFLFTHANGYIKARSGVYQKKLNLATATGKVEAKDSAGSYAMFGERLEYDRQSGVMTLPQRPLLHQYSGKKDGTKDTVAIRADKIIYHQKDEFAEAYGAVEVKSGEMTVFCDTGFFDKRNSWLSMKGNPKCLLENHELSGDSIFLKLSEDCRALESALVVRNAHGVQIEPGKKNKPGTHTEAFGDTLYAEFDGKKLRRLYVNLNANGFFFEEDLPDYKNLMNGRRLELSFENGKMSRATVTGEAESSYFYVKKDRSVAGKNLAAGDTIHIEFDPRKSLVKKLKVRGSSTPSSGRYIDLESIARRAARDSLLADSLHADSIARGLLPPDLPPAPAGEGDPLKGSDSLKTTQNLGDALTGKPEEVSKAAGDSGLASGSSKPAEKLEGGQGGKSVGNASTAADSASQAGENSPDLLQTNSTAQKNSEVKEAPAAQKGK